MDIYVIGNPKARYTLVASSLRVAAVAVTLLANGGGFWLSVNDRVVWSAAFHQSHFENQFVVAFKGTFRATYDAVLCDEPAALLACVKSIRFAPDELSDMDSERMAEFAREAVEDVEDELTRLACHVAA